MFNGIRKKKESNKNLNKKRGIKWGTEGYIIYCSDFADDMD